MATKKREKQPPKPQRMTAGDAIFAELEAMSRAEQEELAPMLLEWLEENDLF